MKKQTSKQLKAQLISTVFTQPREAKVLLLDIETSHSIMADFQLFNAKGNSYTNILREWFIICASWKWLGEKTIYNAAATMRPTKGSFPEWEDKKVVEALYEAIKDADILVGHNITKFDLRKIKARMLFHRKPPLPKIHVIDTLKHSRENYGFTSHRLDYIAQYFGLRRKKDTPKGLWIDILLGKKDAMKTMLNYCDGDINTLEDVLRLFLPAIEASTYHKLPTKGDVACTHCGSIHVVAQGWRKPIGGQYMTRKYQCKSCFKWFKDPSGLAVPFVYPKAPVVKLKDKDKKGKPWPETTKTSIKSSTVRKKRKKIVQRGTRRGASSKKKVR